jgi:hypothetical protein
MAKAARFVLVRNAHANIGANQRQPVGQVVASAFANSVNRVL